MKHVANGMSSKEKNNNKKNIHKNNKPKFQKLQVVETTSCVNLSLLIQSKKSYNKYIGFYDLNL